MCSISCHDRVDDDAALDLERRKGNYVFRTQEIGAIADVLGMISDNDWALVGLSVRETAWEEIYVTLMNG